MIPNPFLSKVKPELRAVIGLDPNKDMNSPDAFQEGYSGLGGPLRVAKFIVTGVDADGQINDLRIIDRGLYEQFPSDLTFGIPLEYDHEPSGTLGFVVDENVPVTISDAQRKHLMGIGDPFRNNIQYGPGHPEYKAWPFSDTGVSEITISSKGLGQFREKGFPFPQDATFIDVTTQFNAAAAADAGTGSAQWLTAQTSDDNVGTSNVAVGGSSNVVIHGSTLTAGTRNGAGTGDSTVVTGTVEKVYSIPFTVPAVDEFVGFIRIGLYTDTNVASSIDEMWISKEPGSYPDQQDGGRNHIRSIKATTSGWSVATGTNLLHFFFQATSNGNTLNGYVPANSFTGQNSKTAMPGHPGSVSQHKTSTLKTGTTYYVNIIKSDKGEYFDPALQRIVYDPDEIPAPDGITITFEGQDDPIGEFTHATSAQQNVGYISPALPNHRQGGKDRIIDWFPYSQSADIRAAANVLELGDHVIGSPKYLLCVYNATDP